METLVWLHDPEMPSEEETNDGCYIDLCRTKCCGCDVKVEWP